MRSKPTSLRERNAIGSRTLVVSFMLLSFAMSALILRQAHETFAGRPLESISGQSARTKKKTVWSATSSGGPPTREGGNDDDYEDDNESEADDNIIVDEEEDYEKDGPWVAPLLCYPNSGSSYTLVNTLALTNRTTATVHSMPKPTVAVRPDYAIPFLAKPHMKNPGLVLTKAHCGGYCFDCPPSPTPGEFDRACRKRFRDEYGIEIIKKFVHLIRDPFDNCVSRMHHGLKDLRGDSADFVQKLKDANEKDPVTGLRDIWCGSLDDRFRRLVPHFIRDRKDADRLLRVPCHAEFIRYVAWHNHAVNVTTFMYPDIPVYRLFYENYTTNYDGVVRELYEEVLRYPPLRDDAEPRPFIAGKRYRSLFAPDHQREVAYLIESLASPQLWRLIRHYFVNLARDEG